MKSTKKSAKTSASETATSPAMLDIAQNIMRSGLEALQDELNKLITGRATKSKHDSASRIAFLTKQVAGIADSVRKIDAVDAKRASKLNRALVLQWLRSVDEDERAQVRRELDAMDDDRGVLA